MCYVQASRDGAPLIQLPSMQPKRDPDDIRYWTQREGGTGFHRGPGLPRAQYSALRERDQHRNLVTDHTPTSIVDTPQDYTPDTVRSRARAALVLAIQRASDTLSDDRNELKLNELAPTMAALGRISGVQLDDAKDSAVTIRIIRDPLPAQAEARLLPPATPYNEVDDYAQRVTAMARDGVTDSEARG